VLRSTGETDEDKARAVCQGWEKAAKDALQKKFSISTARKGFNAVLEIIKKEPMPDVLIGEYLRQWYRDQDTPDAKQTTIRRYKSVVEEFLASIGDNATMPLETLEIADIESFKNKQLKAGKAPGTVNLSIKILRIPLNQARRLGKIMTNPAEGVSHVNAAPNARKTFSNSDIQKLLARADWMDSEDRKGKAGYGTGIQWRGMILLGVGLGMRLQDAADLTWGNIGLEEEVIHYVPHKTSKIKKKTIPLPMTRELHKYFSSIPRGISDSIPVFPSFYKKRNNGEFGLSQRFADLIVGAGIDRQEQTGKKKNVGKGRRFFGLCFHSLRHTCISNLANSGVSKEMRMAIVGHDSDEHDKYTHISLDAKREALDKLPKYKEAK
jgi:integrase